MNIVVGIGGGIAAYKTPLLVRLLKKAGHEVRCVATEHALQFVTPLTLETVSGAKVYCDLFARHNDHETEHVALADWCDAVVVAPATANLIGKMANGIADDALSTLLLTSWRKKTWVCPAMNCEMWSNPAVKRNIDELVKRGMAIIGPDEGALACGASGAGRMSEPETIVAQMLAAEGQGRLRGRSVLVTAGPTHERLDPVRFLGNYSSGKMGFAIAEVLASEGADVQLVAGPTTATLSPDPKINRINVTTACEMYEAATHIFQHCDAAILTAAVADYRPAEVSVDKIKKQGDSGLILTLVQNPDILATLGSMKKEGQTLIGFALETTNEMSHARTKLERKNADYIVLNTLRNAGTCFGSDENQVTIVGRDGCVQQGVKKTKREVAKDIVKLLYR